MRVLHVVWSAAFGGIARLVLDLAAEQAKDPGLEVGAVFARADGEFVEEFRRANIHFHTLGMRRGYDLSWAKLARLRGIMAEYDVLHFHNHHILFAAAVPGGLPVVYTVHGNFGLGRRLRAVDRINDQFKSRFLNQRATYVSFNSAFTGRMAERRYGLSGARRGVIYNGISFEHRERIAGSVPAQVRERLEGGFVVGTASRFVGFKRIDRLVDGFAAFRAGHPAARLLLVGDGPTRGSLESRVREAGLSSDVVFTGFQPNVADYYRMMDVAVFPSEEEPFGLVAVETLYWGKPTIVFEDGGGLVEIVRPVAAADVVPDSAALADRLSYYHAEGGSAAEAERRLARALEFDIRKTAAEFAEVYSMLRRGSTSDPAYEALS